MNRRTQHGAALLLMALIILMTGIGFLLSRTPGNDRVERANQAGDAMMQAKAALIGYAVTYRDTHSDESFGFLPCPDTTNDGVADEPCGDQDVPSVGRLPWKTLGLPPLRDANGDCLWYAVSGNAKNNPKSASPYNWDTISQIILQDASGTALVGTKTAPYSHEQPLALVFSPGPPLAGKTRANASTSECAGSNDVADYLEGIGTLTTGMNTITVANATSAANGTNNDRALWITSKEIFDPIRKRSDFKTAVDTLMYELANCVNGVTPATMATSLMPTGTNKGIDNFSTYVTANCVPYKPSITPDPKRAFFENWKNNLVYAAVSASDMVSVSNNITVTNTPGPVTNTDCKGVLVFGGARTSTQARTDNSDSDNYLEALKALVPKPQTTAIAPGTVFSGAAYDVSAPESDVVTCIKGLPSGATQASFATDFANFATDGGAGAAVADTTDNSLKLQDASGTTGGCFWYANAVPLATKTFRSYYTFQFASADDPTVSPDLRYGFALQITRSDHGMPIGCGTEANSGVLGATATTAAPGIWGSLSFIVETDIYESSSKSDPPGNHTAIMKNGSVDHAGYGVTTSTACNGTANLCEHSPVNKFEETPTPTKHNQRMEITTGCNSACSSCTPASHANPNDYAKVSVWVDCTDCGNVSINLDRTVQPPTVQICSQLDAFMNSVYLGFTGGAYTTYPNVVSIRDFVFRSE